MAGSDGGGAPAQLATAQLATAQLATALHELSAAVLTADDVAGSLQRTAEIAARTVPAGAGAGITLDRRGDAPPVVAASDPLVRSVDESQLAAGRGPALAALGSGAAVDVPDTRAAGRWPEYARAAAVAGIRSSHAEPLHVDEATAGVLTLHSSRTHAFGGRSGPAARLVAGQLELLLAAQRRRAEQALVTAQLAHALERRATIDQAIGIVMAQRGCPPEGAFAALRELSNRSNTPLRDIAAHLVERTGRRAAAPAPRP
jgi:hypothetical protein